MTSSKIRGFQTPALRHPPSLLPDPPRLRHLSPPPISQDDFRQNFSYGKIEK